LQGTPALSGLSLKQGGTGPEDNPARVSDDSNPFTSLPVQSQSNFASSPSPTGPSGSKPSEVNKSSVTGGTSTQSSQQDLSAPVSSSSPQTTFETSIQTSTYTSVSSGHLTTITATATSTVLSTLPTHNSQQGQGQNQSDGGGNDHQTAIIGGVIGALAVLIFAFFIGNCKYLTRHSLAIIAFQNQNQQY
jgi:hypothetical protein